MEAKREVLWRQYRETRERLNYYDQTATRGNVEHAAFCAGWNAALNSLAEDEQRRREEAYCLDRIKQQNLEAK